MTTRNFNNNVVPTLFGIDFPRFPAPFSLDNENNRRRTLEKSRARTPEQFRSKVMTEEENKNRQSNRARMAPLELCFRRGPLRRLPVGRSEAPFEGPAPFAIYVSFYKITVSSARSEKKSRRFLQRHGGIESCREERPRDLRPFFLRCRRLLASPPASSSRSHAPFRLIRWTAANATSNPSQSNALNVSRDCAPHTSHCAS